VLLLCGMVEHAGAASTPPQKTASGSSSRNPDKYTYADPLLIVELQRDRELWGYDVVLDVDIGPNLYAYVNQNPWSKFDPLGLNQLYANQWFANKLTTPQTYRDLGHSVVNFFVEGYKQGGEAFDRGVSHFTTPEIYSYPGGDATTYTMGGVGVVMGGAIIAGELADMASGGGKGKVVKEVVGEVSEKVTKDVIESIGEKSSREVSEEATERMRHYTSRSGSNGIEEDELIKASDQNKVFFEKAKGKPLSRADAEEKYLLKPGKGRDVVETDVPVSRLNKETNPLTGKTEYTVKGDVPLSNADIKKRKD